MSNSTDKQRKSKGKDYEVGYGRPPKAKPFLKGVSGNPAGRPKSITMSEAYRRELAKVDPADEHGRTFAEVLAEQIIIKAKGGDVQAVRELTDRTEGKPRQTVTLSMEKRDQLEQAVSGIISEAEAAGVECSREQAISTLALFTPEVSTLLN
jgi:hypothetical protein